VNGLFRIHIAAEIPGSINLGDMFAVQTTTGVGATSLLEYMPFTWSRVEPPGPQSLQYQPLPILEKHYQRTE
jgi:hypothetical protein